MARSRMKADKVDKSSVKETARSMLGSVGRFEPSMEDGEAPLVAPTAPVVIEQEMVYEPIAKRHERLTHTVYDAINLEKGKQEIECMHIKDQVKVLKDVRSCEKELKVSGNVTVLGIIAMFANAEQVEE